MQEAKTIAELEKRFAGITSGVSQDTLFGATTSLFLAKQIVELRKDLQALTMTLGTLTATKTRIRANRRLLNALPEKDQP